MTICVNCGLEGAHFMPPCLGEPGFFVCEPELVHVDGCECRECLLGRRVEEEVAFAISSPTPADSQEWLDYLEDHSPLCSCMRCGAEAAP